MLTEFIVPVVCVKVIQKCQIQNQKNLIFFFLEQYFKVQTV